MPELSTSPCCRASLRPCADAESQARFPSLALALPFFFPRMLQLLAGTTVAAMAGHAISMAAVVPASPTSLHPN